MKLMNLYRAGARVPERDVCLFVKLESLTAKKYSERRSILQANVNRLVKKGIDCTIAPKKYVNEYDLVVLNPTEQNRKIAQSQLRKYLPKYAELTTGDMNIFDAAWKNRLRIHLANMGYFKVGVDRYVLRDDLLNRNRFKPAVRIQATLIDGYPSLYLDLRTRIMNYLSEDSLEIADQLKEESEVQVRVLPNWYAGILQGRCEYTAGDREYPIGDMLIRGDRYWKLRHGIDFITAKDEMVNVYVHPFEKTLSYPRKCVFLEFERGSSLPSYLKKTPEDRVKYSVDLLQGLLPIPFVGMDLNLVGPLTISELGYEDYRYGASREFSVVVGGNTIISLSNLHNALKLHGPFSGPIKGKYVVFYPASMESKQAKNAMDQIEQAFRTLHLGSFKPLERIGESSFVEVGSKLIDYTSAITDARTKLDKVAGNCIAMIILPKASASSVYYRSRGKLFEKLFDYEPIKAQALKSETAERLNYYMAANIASQCYVKLGGTGSAMWILNNAADSAIPGIAPGSTCYMCYDISRRRKLKASATAYSALTDPYGRFIMTGTNPVGGEKLTPLTFYDVIIEMIQNVAIFNRRFQELDKARHFDFRRLVFAKDGKIYWDEARMMEDVILYGIPEEGRDPLAEVLKNKLTLPKKLTIDILGVNKSANRRIYERNGGYRNVAEGSGLALNGVTGLLVSASTRQGTVQPLELTLHRHINLNTKVPEPSIAQMMEEYYYLTNLDWASLFKQGKFALPQILTQNLGENITAGITVPDNMILL